jgi:hypothetical protein
MWYCRRIEISWTDHVKNEEVYIESRRKGASYITIKRRKANWIVTSCAGTAFSNTLLKER